MPINIINYIQATENMVGENHPEFLEDTINRPIKELINNLDNGADIPISWNNITDRPSPQITITLIGDVTGEATLTQTELGTSFVSIRTTNAVNISYGTEIANINNTLTTKANLNGENNFTGPQRTGTTAQTNAIDFRLNNNFTINATSANITVTSLVGCIGQSGVIVIESAENITGWGAEFIFKNIPIDLNGIEVFSYFIQTETVIRIGRVS